ncbi:hypothetical protein JCM15519_33740 [Fundidesulfovibrio butyratiphilus]
MLKRVLRCVLYAMLALSLAVPAALAQDAKTNVSDAKGAKPSDDVKRVEALAMAAQLIDYGRTHKSALALLTAAQIMKNTPSADAKQAKATEGEATSQAAGKGQVPSPEKLLVEAKAMAKDNPKLLELIEQESKMGGSRQVVGGPKRILENVKAHTTDVFTLTFRESEPAAAAIIGDGDTDLDLFVYDQNGNLIGKDDDSTSRCLVEWRPRWTGPFKIKVKNNGNVSSDYLLLIP